MRYDPLEIAAAMFFFYFSNREALGRSLNRPHFLGGVKGGGGPGGGGNHLIFRRIEGGIIRNWEPKKEIIEEELRN